MNKISKMQKGFFGAVRIAHTNCIDNAGELINAAKYELVEEVENELLEFCRERLLEIHDEYVEREQRWTRIATLLNRDELTNFNSSTSSTPVTYRGKDSPRLRM